MEPRNPKSIPSGRVGRVAPLIGLAGRTAGEAVVASLRKNRTTQSRTDVHARAAERYVERLGHSRGVLMKAGQILSMAIPESTVEGNARGVYQRAFAKLFYDAPPMPTAIAIATVEAELGRPVGELFASFEPKPLAAASIGQVHAATLHDGTRVVVKVQYPGVEQAIRADLANTELLGTFLQLVLTLVPNLARMDVRAMAQEISERIGEEIDYLTEARNQREFADAYRAHPFIRIPEVHDEFTTRRVLTMQFDDGMRYPDATRAEQELRDRWGEAIYRFTWRSLRRLGINNADAHPGNYLFHPDGTVTFLDFGCVKRLTEQQVDGLVGVTRRALDGDAEELHRFGIQCGYIGRDVTLAPADWLKVMTETMSYMTQPQPFTITPETIAGAWRNVLRGPEKRVIRKISPPADEQTMWMRLGTGLMAVLGGLHATGYWTAITEECCYASPPTTAYGRLDTEFWEART